MRDKIKDSMYFEKYIIKRNSSISKLENILPQVISEKGEGYEGVRSGYGSLEMYYLHKIKALYSNGSEILEVKELYPRFLECFIRNWTVNDGIGALIDVVSLGILLNIDKVQIEKLIEFMKQEDINDIIIDFLVSKMDSGWKIRDNDVRYPLAYELLGTIIMEGNKDKQLELLKQYLDQWYHNSDDTAWHDSHKSKHNTYNGYWSFEAAALAKALGLDDSSFKDHQYYPYDMVHFKG